MKSDLEGVLFLLSLGVDVNSRTQDSNVLSPLVLAVAVGNDMIVRNLLLAGAAGKDDRVFSAVPRLTLFHPQSTLATRATRLVCTLPPSPTSRPSPPSSSPTTSTSPPSTTAGTAPSTSQSRRGIWMWSGFYSRNQGISIVSHLSDETFWNLYNQF